MPGAAPALALAELLPEGRAWEGCQQQLLMLAPKLEASKESMESGAVIWSGKRGTGVVGREAAAELLAHSTHAVHPPAALPARPAGTRSPIHSVEVESVESVEDGQSCMKWLRKPLRNRGRRCTGGTAPAAGGAMPCNAWLAVLPANVDAHLLSCCGANAESPSCPAFTTLGEVREQGLLGGSGEWGGEMAHALMLSPASRTPCLAYVFVYLGETEAPLGRAVGIEILFSIFICKHTLPMGEHGWEGRHGVQHLYTTEGTHA